MRLSHLRSIEPRAVWESEAQHFTPWLAEPENFDVLAKTLHFVDAEVEATERAVGAFSADIVARDRDGLILIENQLEQTDHTHLGQILTYLAGLEETLKVVWISTRLRDEHRAAIDWLNSNTPSQFLFFGVELEVYQIEDSAAAPYFHVAARPNEWSRHISARARQAASGVADGRSQFYRKFWSFLAAYLEEHDDSFGSGNPPSRHWWRFGIGRAGFDLSVSATTRNDFIAVEVYIHNDSEKRKFDYFLRLRSEIEAEFGETLEWQRLDDGVGSRVTLIWRDAGVEDEANWPSFAAWYLDKLTRFKSVFGPRIRAIDLDDPDNAPAQDVSDE
jgi:hypothetical protein